MMAEPPGLLPAAADPPPVEVQASAAGVPVAPWSGGALEDSDEALAEELIRDCGSIAGPAGGLTATQPPTSPPLDSAQKQAPSDVNK